MADIACFLSLSMGLRSHNTMYIYLYKEIYIHEIEICRTILSMNVDLCNYFHEGVRG